MNRLSFTLFPLFVLICFSCSLAQKKNPIPEPTEMSFRLEKVVGDVEIPWGIALLPDGSLLYTEKEGELIHFNKGQKTTIKNTPTVWAHGQGGLLDVVLDPKYLENGWIYLSYSASEDGKTGNTRMLRAKMEADKLVNIEPLYRGVPDTDKPYHFGSRMAFDRDGHLYFSIGDRGNRAQNPQDITRDGGKIYRINSDGSIPSDNPFVNTSNAKPAIYSYGHRNPQGVATHPKTGKIWTHEHGPKGGDEINISDRGENNGWPEITFGINYNGSVITNDTSKVGMEQPLHYWVPSIAPCGMDFIHSDYYGEWNGDLLIGSLKFQYLNRCVMDGEKVVREERLFDQVGRVRDVYQAPDGFVYVSIEYEGIFKLVKN